MAKSYWLLKTEPQDWAWQQQIKSGNKGAEWNGVRNFQAAKNLKNMKLNDKCFFYYTGKEKNFIPVFPPINLCSVNAAMIAWAGIKRFKINLIDNLEFSSKARWPLDSSASFLKGPGLKI